MKKKLILPTEKDWGNYKEDLDLIEMYKNIYGKKYNDIYYYYNNGLCISMSHDLLVSSRSVFQYYIYSYILYLHSTIGSTDEEAKEVFLSLLLSKENRDKNSVFEIYKQKIDIFYIDNNLVRHEFHISLQDMVYIIENEYKQKKIDNEIYDDIPNLLNNIKTIMN